MAEDTQLTESKIAIEYQQKFMFYLLGLTFTLLALSIQTASFGENNIPNIIEICGWISLLISGLFGLSRIEWTAVFYFLSSEKRGIKNQIETVKKISVRSTGYIRNLDSGEDIPIGDFVSKKADIQNLIEKRIDVLQSRMSFRYHLQRILFLLGILCLMVYRGYSPVIKILCL